jgi:hypothetical protein
MEDRKTAYRAKRIGICRSIGRHPAAGLTPYSLYRFMICWFCLFGSSLNFSRISFIIGVSACIRFIDFMLVRVSGWRASLMMIEKTMITQP